MLKFLYLIFWFLKILYLFLCLNRGINRTSPNIVASGVQTKTKADLYKDERTSKYALFEGNYLHAFLLTETTKW